MILKQKRCSLGSGQLLGMNHKTAVRLPKEEQKDHGEGGTAIDKEMDVDGGVDVDVDMDMDIDDTVDIDINMVPLLLVPLLHLPNPHYSFVNVTGVDVDNDSTEDIR